MAQKHDVFISYKSEEFAEAAWVRSVLEENGITCWMAPASIPGGSSYADEIDDAISACSVFVLILSAKAQESKWVKKELDMALNREKVILPFTIENCRLQKAFNLYLTDVQRYDAFTDRADAITAMIRRIGSVLGRTVPEDGIPAAAPTAAPAPAAARKRPKHLLRSVLFFTPYAIGLLLPLILWIAGVEFTLLWRIFYFLWIVMGACWLLYQIETRPQIAALCFGTLLEEDLNEPPAAVFSKIASVFGKKAFISSECPPGFTSYYKLRLIEFGSWDGRRVNYLKIEFRRGLEYYDPSILYLHTLSRGGQAVKMLTRQGFLLQTPPACISPATDYLRRGDLHVCLYYKRRALHGAILYNCSEAELTEHFQGEWKDEK